MFQKSIKICRIYEIYYVRIRSWHIRWFLDILQANFHLYTNAKVYMIKIWLSFRAANKPNFHFQGLAVHFHCQRHQHLVFRNCEQYEVYSRFHCHLSNFLYNRKKSHRTLKSTSCNFSALPYLALIWCIHTTRGWI